MTSDAQLQTSDVSRRVPESQVNSMTIKAFHPLAGMLPLVQGAEFERFVANIREQGLLSPATSYQGMKSLYRPFDNYSKCDRHLHTWK